MTSLAQSVYGQILSPVVKTKMSADLRNLDRPTKKKASVHKEIPV